jgi:hypothetical protein
VNNIMFRGVRTHTGASIMVRHRTEHHIMVCHETVCGTERYVAERYRYKMVNVTKCFSITKQCVQKMVIDAINDEKRPFISL